MTRSEAIELIENWANSVSGERTNRKEVAKACDFLIHSYASDKATLELAYEVRATLSSYRQR